MSFYTLLGSRSVKLKWTASFVDNSLDAAFVYKCLQKWWQRTSKQGPKQEAINRRVHPHRFAICRDALGVSAPESSFCDGCLLTWPRCVGKAATTISERQSLIVLATFLLIATLCRDVVIVISWESSISSSPLWLALLKCACASGWQSHSLSLPHHYVVASVLWHVTFPSSMLASDGLCGTRI